MAEIVVVLTGKNLETMFKEGGSGMWRATPERLAEARYLVCARNTSRMDESWAAKEGPPQGTGFLIARGLGVVPSDTIADRWIVTFKEYAQVQLQGTWEGQRNPVAYRDSLWIEELFERNEQHWETLVWKPGPTPPSEAIPAVRGLSIHEAKAGLAYTFGVPIANIDIVIRG
jgi:hypothetical protein